jgi:hypothetical protein
MTITDEILREYDNKVNELKKDMQYNDIGETMVHEFGFKWADSRYVHTVVDWGNIRKFLSESIKRAVREYDKKAVALIVSDGEQAEESMYVVNTVARKQALAELGIGEEVPK